MRRRRREKDKTALATLIQSDMCKIESIDGIEAPVSAFRQGPSQITQVSTTFRSAEPVFARFGARTHCHMLNLR